MPIQSDVRVAICICTFRRPELLRELLDGIAQLTFRKVKTPQIQIVVVDNDELASAKDICSTVPAPWPIKYVVEAARGITHARNRAVAEAGLVDFIAFIDDDEVPSAQWLEELLWTQAGFNADVVSGPVSPKYAPRVADWIKSGGFFDSRISTTGIPQKVCATNNVLIGSHVFRRVARFDDAFVFSGAEDTNFFLRARQAGHKIVWSQEAVVFEAISAQRATVGWILRREYQTGNGWVFCEAGVDNRLRGRIVRFCKAWGHIVIASVNAIWSLLWLNRAAVIRALQRVSLGLGMLAGLAGLRFLAYEKRGLEQVRGLTAGGRVERTSKA
jgi:succinoglycan biosynthesis protein ExoM